MQLIHSFIQGIRFDTELHHAVKPNSRRVSYISLPIKVVEDVDTDGGLMSLAQAVTILAQKRFAFVAKSLVDQCITHPDKLEYHPKLKVVDLNIQARYLQGKDKVDIGATLKCSIAQGQIGVIRLTTDTQSFWSLIVGVEYDLATCRTKALLLLDSQEYEPWCTAHNARLEIGKQFCIYRVLTGSYKAVQIDKVCILSRTSSA